MDDDPHLGVDSPRILISDRQDAPVDATALAEVARGGRPAGGGAGAPGRPGGVGAPPPPGLVGRARAELSLSFVAEDEIAELHERYLDEPGPTDVLSFPLDDVDEDGTRILGDVVVAPSVAAVNNPSDTAGELKLLVAHGVLHLLGYDHEEDTARAEMWERQERYSGVRAP